MKVPAPYPPEITQIIDEMAETEWPGAEKLQRQLESLMRHPQAISDQLLLRLEEVRDALQEIRAEVKGLQQYVVDLLEVSAKN